MNNHFKFPFWNPEVETAVQDFLKSIQVENTKDHGWSWNRPLANIEESKDAYLIHLAAPGLVKSDFKLSLDKSILKVEVDKPKVETENKVKNEYSFNKFSRNFKISDTVDTALIAAAYENGILIITLPKKADAANAPKTINII